MAGGFRADVKLKLNIISLIMESKMLPANDLPLS